MNESNVTTIAVKTFSSLDGSHGWIEKEAEIEADQDQVLIQIDNDPFSALAIDPFESLKLAQALTNGTFLQWTSGKPESAGWYLVVFNPIELKSISFAERTYFAFYDGSEYSEDKCYPIKHGLQPIAYRDFANDYKAFLDAVFKDINAPF